MFFTQDSARKVAVQSPEISNFLGTGSDPQLRLTLGKNQAGWKSYTIDYGNKGFIPFDGKSSPEWSTWNVVDAQGNYYGTITLNASSSAITWDKYVAGKDGYYLEDVNLAYNKGSQSFGLSAGKIHRPSNNNGPFPDAPRAKPAVYHGTTQPIKLSVQGDKIVNDFGKDIRFKGLVRPSLEWNKQGQFLSAQDIKSIATWDGNVVRLDLNQVFWLNSEGPEVKGSYKQIIDAIIYYATQNNMAVILDLHWPVADGQGVMANQDSLIFWTEVASAYKDFGTVIYELFNEPANISPQVWLNGDADQGYVGMQQMYDAVRATGADNLVLVNGTDWAYDLSFVSDNFRVQGTNIIYGSHPYDDKGADNYTGFAWWSEPGDPAFPTMISDWSGTPHNGGTLVHTDMQQDPASQLFQAPNLQHQHAGKNNELLTHVIGRVSQMIEQASRENQSEKIIGVLQNCLTDICQHYPQGNISRDELLYKIELCQAGVEGQQFSRYNNWGTLFYSIFPSTTDFSLIRIREEIKNWPQATSQNHFGMR